MDDGTLYHMQAMEQVRLYIVALVVAATLLVAHAIYNERTARRVLASKMARWGLDKKDE